MKCILKAFNRFLLTPWTVEVERFVRAESPDAENVS